MLLAFDGWEAMNVTTLPIVLDNLIAAGEIPPVLAVMIDSGTLDMRYRELDCHEPFVAFPVRRSAATRHLWKGDCPGSGRQGVGAGRDGSFEAPSTSEPLEVYLDVGLLEIDSSGERAFLLGVRRFREVLQSAGHNVHYAELACGHDDLVTGETIADGLRLLL